MKVRMLWKEPGNKDFELGEVYDLADGADFVSGGHAEEVQGKVKALPDPRSAPTAEAATEAA